MTAVCAPPLTGLHEVVDDDDVLALGVPVLHRDGPLVPITHLDTQHKNTIEVMRASQTPLLPLPNDDTAKGPHPSYITFLHDSCLNHK